MPEDESIPTERVAKMMWFLMRGRRLSSPTSISAHGLACSLSGPRKSYVIALFAVSTSRPPCTWMRWLQRLQLVEPGKKDLAMQALSMMVFVVLGLLVSACAALAVWAATAMVGRWDNERD